MLNVEQEITARAVSALGFILPSAASEVVGISFSNADIKHPKKRFRGGRSQFLIDRRTSLASLFSSLFLFDVEVTTRDLRCAEGLLHVVFFRREAARPEACTPSNNAQRFLNTNNG